MKRHVATWLLIAFGILGSSSLFAEAGGVPSPLPEDLLCRLSPSTPTEQPGVPAPEPRALLCSLQCGLACQGESVGSYCPLADGQDGICVVQSTTPCAWDGLRPCRCRVPF